MGALGIGPGGRAGMLGWDLFGGAGGIGLARGMGWEGRRGVGASGATGGANPNGVPPLYYHHWC